MTTMAHIAYPALAYLGVSTVSGYHVPNNELYIVIGSAVAPDFDFLYQLARRKWFDSSFQHHNWLTHLPVTYLPLFLLAFFTDSHTLNLISYGIFSHLFLDMFFVADGLKIFFPLQDKFYGLFIIETDGNHGNVWVRKYMNRFIFKLDILAIFVLSILVILRSIQ